MGTSLRLRSGASRERGLRADGTGPRRRTRHDLVGRGRRLRFESLERRELLADMAVHFKFTEYAGAAPQPDWNAPSLASLSVGDQFWMELWIEDIRSTPNGVFEAFFDVGYNSNLLSATGVIEHGDAYNSGKSPPDPLVPSGGQILKTGGVDRDFFASAPGDPFLLFRVPFRADAPGALTLALDVPDEDSFKPRFFVPFSPIELDQIAVDGQSIQIVDAGTTVSPTSGLITTEAGAQATFSVRLNTAPTASVTIPISSSDTTEGSVSPASLTFTTSNWSQAQTVTVTGIDDAVDDGNVSYTIVLAPASSPDAKYSGHNPVDVSVTNNDDDAAGIVVTPGPSMVTSEAGGWTTFSVVLASEPTSSVTIPISSSDPSEGTVSPATVTFTTTNWNQARTVTVTGINDAVVDGDIGYTILLAPASSQDPNYNGRDAGDVAVTNTDNDTAGIVVTPGSGLVTSEAGAPATFSVVLASEPTADVTFPLSSSDTTEGTVSPASLTFTAANWNQARTVTVTGVNDAVDDGDIGYTILLAPAVSQDPNYNGRDAGDVAVTNTDNDTAGIVVTPGSGLVTSEAGAPATFSIVLASEPTANVAIPISSSDATEGTVSPASVTFTTANWNQSQMITVTGVNDDVDDGDVAYTTVLSPAVSQDPKYNGRDAMDVSAKNTDNDTAGIVVTPGPSMVTNEAGATATFSVVLASEPTANVTISIASSDATEGTVSPTSVTFTATNWNQARTVTVTGVNDAVDDGDVVYAIVLAPAVSQDPKYSNSDAQDVSVTNTDDDTAGILLAPGPSMITSEAGGSATFSVVLASEPTAGVTIPLSSSDTSEGTVSPASVTFTPANWNQPQTVTVTGINDAVDDGDIVYRILTSPAVSLDPKYGGRDVADVAVTSIDNDTAGIVVAPGSTLVTSEAGGSATFTIVLISEPTAYVTIPLSSSNTAEGTVSPASVTFAPGNWSQPQTVTVTGVDETVADGDAGYTIILGAASSQDPQYGGRDADDLQATNIDNDVPGITAMPISGLVTTEAGGTATFQIVLNTLPAAEVTIGLTTSDPTEVTIVPASVKFLPGDWNVPQTVTLTGVDDDLTDGDASYAILTAAAVSDDSSYHGLDAVDVLAVNRDDDGLAVIQVKDSSANPDDKQIQFVTDLSRYRPLMADSPLVRQAYPDDRQYFDVFNAGDAPLVLEAIEIHVPGVSIDRPLGDGAADDLTILPGKTERFRLTYAPTDEAESFDLESGVVIVSNAQDAAEFSIALRGESTTNADISYDGRVNLSDLGPLNVNFGKVTGTAGFDPSADINGDGRVNLTDLGPLNVAFGWSREAALIAAAALQTPADLPTSPPTHRPDVPSGDANTDLLMTQLAIGWTEELLRQQPAKTKDLKDAVFAAFPWEEWSR